MSFLWNVGLKTLAALSIAATLAPTVVAEEVPGDDLAKKPAPSTPAPVSAESRPVTKIASIDPGASGKAPTTAPLQAIGIEQAADLLRAIDSKNRASIDLQLNAGANVNAAGEQGRTPLFAAAQAHDWPLVEQLLKAGADPKVADEKGLTPLMVATIAGSVPAIERLLAAGAPIDAVDSKGRLALGHAIASRQLEAMAALLLHEPTLPAGAPGADDLATVALETGDRDLLENILRRLPTGLTWSQPARTAFSQAFAAHDTILAPLLMEKFAGPPAASEHAQPLLAYAIATRNGAQVHALLELGADPNTVLDQPADAAFRESVNASFMKYYLDSAPGLNVLMLAAGLKQADTVKKLLECGANRNASTKGKSSLLALYFAAWADSPETIQVLLGSAPSKDDVRIEVSLNEQRARYFRYGQLVLSSEISTGRDGFATKTGEFVITDKHLEHHSTLYHNASMPYFMRLSCQAFGLHQGYVTGRPASHGCIRLPGEVARRLFKEAPIGTWVSITAVGIWR